MEETLENQKGEDFRIFHPSFYQCLSVFLIPLPMLLFLFYGVRLFYVLLLFWLLVTSFLIFVWVFLATTFYVLLPDRIEIRTGVFVKRSRTIPFDKIINITCKQNLAQRIFGIGDILIDTAGGTPFEVALVGVVNQEKVKDLLFALKKKGATCLDIQ
jgi:putative membrane protein